MDSARGTTTGTDATAEGPSTPSPGRRRSGSGGPWARFRRDRLAQASLVVLIAATGTSLLALPFAVDWYNVQDLQSAVRHPPSLHPVTALRQYDAQPQPSWATRLAHRVSSLAGHDDLGRSLLFRLSSGFLVSLLVGLAAAVFAVALGTLWGCAAGVAGGRVDMVLMRIVDVLYGLPYILMVILLKVGLTRPLTVLLAGHSRYADLVILTLAIGGISWLTPARVIRGQVLSLRARPFIDAARAAGAGPFHILRWHLLPNLIGPMMVYATLVIPQAILQESFLSFLGVGVQQPVPSLGRLAADGVEAVNTFVGFWWLIVFPCGLLVATLLAVNFIGDGLRDAVDPASPATMVT